MWYNLNFNILARLLLPSFLRKQALINYCNIVLLPISNIYDVWLSFRYNNIYKLAHNGQVCFLRKVLNDKFDPQLRRIRIGNGNSYERYYIYTTAENRPNFLGVSYIHNHSDYSDTGVDFIVYAPHTISAMQTQEKYELKALIDFYKEGVKRYKIIAE